MPAVPDLPPIFRTHSPTPITQPRMHTPLQRARLYRRSFYTLSPLHFCLPLELGIHHRVMYIKHAFAIHATSKLVVIPKHISKLPQIRLRILTVMWTVLCSVQVTVIDKDGRRHPLLGMVGQTLVEALELQQDMDIHECAHMPMKLIHFVDTPHACI